MTTFAPKLVDPPSQKPLTYKAFPGDFFTRKQLAGVGVMRRRGRHRENCPGTATRAPASGSTSCLPSPV
jgi:hypothetical protein